MGDAAEGEPGDQAGSLFDRWLTHYDTAQAEQAATQQERTAAARLDQEPEPDPLPTPPRRSRGFLDGGEPPGWQPIVMASMRKKAESRSVPAKGGRLRMAGRRSKSKPDPVGGATAPAAPPATRPKPSYLAPPTDPRTPVTPSESPAAGPVPSPDAPRAPREPEAWALQLAEDSSTGAATEPPVVDTVVDPVVDTVVDPAPPSSEPPATATNSATKSATTKARSGSRTTAAKKAASTATTAAKKTAKTPAAKKTGTTKKATTATKAAPAVRKAASAAKKAASATKAAPAPRKTAAIKKTTTTRTTAPAATRAPAPRATSAKKAPGATKAAPAARAAASKTAGAKVRAVTVEPDVTAAATVDTRAAESRAVEPASVETPVLGSTAIASASIATPVIAAQPAVDPTPDAATQQPPLLTELSEPTESRAKIALQRVAALRSARRAGVQVTEPVAGPVRQVDSPTPEPAAESEPAVAPRTPARETAGSVEPEPEPEDLAEPEPEPEPAPVAQAGPLAAPTEDPPDDVPIAPVAAEPATPAAQPTTRDLLMPPTHPGSRVVSRFGALLPRSAPDTPADPVRSPAPQPPTVRKDMPVPAAPSSSPGGDPAAPARRPAPWTPDAVRELFRDVETRPAEPAARAEASEPATPEKRRGRLTRAVAASAPGGRPEADEASADSITSRPARAGAVTTAAIPHEVHFKPRRGARRAASLLLLAGLVATAVAGALAYREQTTYNVAITGVLGALTGVIWAVRAGAGVAKLSVKGGQLQVLRDGTTFLFDLNSPYTPIEVHGRPGRSGWRVKFIRRGMSPFVVDSSVVDGHEFMRVLRHYRPE